MISVNPIRRRLATLSTVRYLSLRSTAATAPTSSTSSKSLPKLYAQTQTPVAARLTQTPQLRHFHQSSFKMSGEVKELATKKEFDNALSQDGSLVVLDCHATWCGPCKMISPKIESFAQTYQNARFYKLDVDAVPEVAEQLGIRAMPTIVFFRNGEKTEEVVGANPKAIEGAIQNNLG